MEIPEQKRLEQVTKKLAEILRIEDWDIDVEVVNAVQMNKASGNFDDQGCVKIDFYHKTGSIKIGKDSVENWYQTLLHELLHLQEAAFHMYLKNKFNVEDDPCCTLFEEQRINELAKIFVKLYPVTNFNDILGK